MRVMQLDSVTTNLNGRAATMMTAQEYCLVKRTLNGRSQGDNEALFIACRGRVIEVLPRAVYTLNEL